MIGWIIFIIILILVGIGGYLLYRYAAKLADNFTPPNPFDPDDINPLDGLEMGLDDSELENGPTF